MKSPEHVSIPSAAASDWRALSACRDADPELFFPLSPSGPGLTQIAKAKVVCGRCQVREQCLRFALNSGQEFGIWGGTSEDERRRLARAGHRPLQWQVLTGASQTAADRVQGTARPDDQHRSTAHSWELAGQAEGK
jgi:WhiB family transcriptional regulator, redox-sensing transcriptional regulator